MYVNAHFELNMIILVVLFSTCMAISTLRDRIQMPSPDWSSASSYGQTLQGGSVAYSAAPGNNPFHQNPAILPLNQEYSDYSIAGQRENFPNAQMIQDPIHYQSRPEVIYQQAQNPSPQQSIYPSVPFYSAPSGGLSGQPHFRLQQPMSDVNYQEIHNAVPQQFSPQTDIVSAPQPQMQYVLPQQQQQPVYRQPIVLPVKVLSPPPTTQRPIIAYLTPIAPTTTTELPKDPSAQPPATTTTTVTTNTEVSTEQPKKFEPKVISQILEQLSDLTNVLKSSLNNRVKVAEREPDNANEMRNEIEHVYDEFD